MSKLPLLAIVAALLLGSSASVHAQASSTARGENPSAGSYVSERVSPAGYRRHDGFYLRMLTGVGVGGSKYRDGLTLDDGQTRTLGSASFGELAVGWAVRENFIVHATLNGGGIEDERKTVGHHHVQGRDPTTIVGFFGGGLTYYLMPANVYFTGSVGLGGLGEISASGHQHHHSKPGLGTSFAVGKEWWIGGQWGLGAALTGAYYQGSLELHDSHSTYRGFSSGVALSATFN